MEQWLTRRWYGDSAPLVLKPLSCLYGLVIAIRGRLYAWGGLRRHRVARPVLVVGNLTVGGTGKTPLVAWLARQLTQCGFKVGILSRGYGRSGSAPRWVTPDADWREVGDEPLLLRRATGCLTVVAADRVAGARLLVGEGIEVVIVDDGLQHLRLARDCEIVVVDGARGFGNGNLLPSGPLREPLSRLASVDGIVVNGSAARPIPGPSIQMTLLATQALPLGGETNPRPLASFRGQRVHAVAGIGNPSRFFADLRAAGMEVIEHPFADHHAFVASDLGFNDDLPVLMTEKDAVKCRRFARPGGWYVPVTAQFSPADAALLLERVMSRFPSDSKES